MITDMRITLPPYIRGALDALEENDFEAYIGGCCVRDLLLGKNTENFDIFTNAMPEQIKKCFSGKGIANISINQGEVEAFTPSEQVKFNIFRTDNHGIFQKRPSNSAYSAALSDELANMDFTVNSMAYNERTGFIDNFGGLSDIFHRKISCIGEPAIRFNQNPMRIMSALRYAATLGFEIDGLTALAVHDFKKLLKHISPKRLVGEFNMFLTGLSSAQHLIDYADVVATLMPEISGCIGFKPKSRNHVYDIWTHTAIAIENSPHDLETRLALLMHDLAKPECADENDEYGDGQYLNHEKKGAEKAEIILNRLGYDNKTVECVTTLIKYHYVTIIDDPKIIKRLLVSLGKDNFLKLVEMIKSNNKAKSNLYFSNMVKLESVREVALKIIENDEYIDIEKLAVTSADLSAMGFSGRYIGEILKMLLMDVIDEVTPNVKEALIDRINKIFKDNRFFGD